MEYEDRIICFLDILAFREHVSQSVQPDGSDSSEKINQLAGALSAIRKNLSYDRLGPPLTQVTQFSDSVAISFPTHEESGVFHALVSILWVQIELVSMGILCRGAVTRGKLIHTSELLFGPAMVNAYFLESKAALYPRVILDESIIESGMRADARHHEPGDEQRSIMSLLKKDTDGMYYINYITAAQSELDEPDLDYPEYLSRMSMVISSGLELKDPSVVVKYRWLNEKFSPHLAMIKRAAQKITDHELRETYLSIQNPTKRRLPPLKRERLIDFSKIARGRAKRAASGAKGKRPARRHGGAKPS